jgi:hypothetical protein
VGIGKNLSVGYSIDAYNGNNLIRDNFSNKTLGTRAVTTWTTRVSAVNIQWRKVCWSAELGLFCAVADTGTGSRIMTSSDGINWTSRTTPVNNAWRGLCWSAELGLFCAAAYTSSLNSVMTSPDGITWTTQTTPNTFGLHDVCWSPELGLFCAVSLTASAANRVLTSPDGITWTTRASAANNAWYGMCWSPELGLFCAVSSSANTSGVMTSSDGINWTTRTTNTNNWTSVGWSAELGIFCAVASSGTGNRVMTSSDGITWTTRASAADLTWWGVSWSPELGLFCSVAVSGTGNRVMTSPDGITWTTRASAADNAWYDVCWSPELGIFCAAAGANVMTSKQVTDTKSRQMIDGIVSMVSSVNSTSTTTGALTVIGGVGMGGNLSVGGSTTILGTTTLNGNLAMGVNDITSIGDITSTGIITTSSTLKTTDATVASSTSTGALQVTGGVGIGGAMYVGGAIVNSITTQSTSTSTGGLVVSGGVGIAKDVYVDGYTNIDNSVENHQSFVGLDASHTTFIASYKDNIDADYARGSRYVTATAGSVTFSNGKLTLSSAANNYVRYSAVGNAQFTQQGTIKFKLTPNYSGIPAGYVIFANIGIAGSSTNGIWFRHLNASGQLGFGIINSTGTFIVDSFALGVWLPIAGTEYEFELDIDISNGFSRLFIDGKQFGATQTGTGIRNTSSNTIQIGSWIAGGTYYSNFSIRDIEIFDNVQHTTDYQVSRYTPDYSLQNAITTYGLNASGPANLANLNVEGQQEVKFMASFASSINADYGLGSTLVVTTSGSVAITNGKLVLGAGTGNYVRYSAQGNANFTQAGAIKFKLTPNYSGIPAATVGLVGIGATGIITNLIQFSHLVSSGNIAIAIYEFDNDPIVTSASFGAWSPVSGTEYEFELNMDLTVGATRVFIDGALLGGTTLTQTGVRTNTGQLIQIGGYIYTPEADLANFAMRDLIIYNTVQHTAAYTPGYSTESIYTTHISGPAKILGQTIMGDVNLTGHIESYNSNNLMRNTFSNTTLGTRAVSTWTTRVTPSNSWFGVCWSPELGLFCAVATSGTGNRVMTSSDGITWTTRASATDNVWNDVCWSPELGLFCSVASTGTGNRVMTSPDGITWTTRANAVDNDWSSVNWSPELGLFCAVAITGTGNRVMTSPDGNTWTSRVSAADNGWLNVCWSPELSLFCAVSYTGTGDRVMTSPDGITWTTRASAANQWWETVCWSPELGLFCAVAGDAILNSIMTSPDGIIWTIRANTDGVNLRSVCWSSELGLFCAIASAGTGNRVTTSPDGISWTSRVAAVANQWRHICWSPELGIFCAVADSGTNNRVMTSKHVLNTTTRQVIDGIVTLTSSVGSTSSSTGALVVNGGIGIGGAISAYNDGGLYYKAYDNYGIGNGVLPWNLATGRILQTGITTTLSLTDPIYGGQGDYVALRIMGWIKPLYTETYTFELTAINDSAILFIDNREVTRSFNVTATGTIALTANRWVPIYIEWLEVSGTSKLQVQWSSTTQVKGDIPAANMRYNQFDNAPSVLGTSIVNGIMTITRTDSTTSTSSGALVVSGGVGIAKDVFIDGYTNIDNSVENHQSFVGLDASHTTFITSYKDNLDADYARGSRYVTLTNGSVTLTNGKLVLGSGQNNYVRYSAVSNANFTQQGTIKFKYTPNYSGTMTANAVIFNIGVTALSTTNAIWIYHRASNSNLVLVLVGAAEVSLGAWSPIAGSEYEFELDIDISNGASRLFVDGKQFGSTITTTGIRNNTSAIIQVGSWIGSNVDYSNFSIRDIEIFDNVQHTSDYQTNKYTPNYSLQSALTTYGLNASGPANLANLNVEGQQEVKFMASFASSLNADYGLGSTLVATTSGSVAITNGKLVLGSGTENYVRYSAQGNADFTQTGAIKFKYTPNYTKPDSDSTFIINIGNIGTTLGYHGQIRLLHDPAGNLLISIAPSPFSVWIFDNVSFGLWSYVAGTEYEFELNIDITLGATRLFINGIQFGSTLTGTGTRTAVSSIQIGAYLVNSSGTANFSMRDLIIYNTVQHTANYTPGYSTESIYTTHISGPAKILGQTIMSDVHLTGRIDSYNSNNLMRSNFSNSTLGTRAVSTWTTRVSTADNNWGSVCWSAELGLFCTVAGSGTGNRVMTSPDGITWTTRASAADNAWYGICWSPELGLFCAVSTTGTLNRVMTSPDGITWTTRASAADNQWTEVVWAAELGLFCAIAASGTLNRVMTSSDGINWTTRTTTAETQWNSVCWSPEVGIFCAVAGTGTGNRVMTSPDGITWTTRTTPVDNSWIGIRWSAELGLFCAVAETGTGNRVMTSSDGITWTTRTSAADNNWVSVCWTPELGLFCAVAYTNSNSSIMTSPDGIIWTTKTCPIGNGWRDVCWSPELGIFCSVSYAIGSGNRVMTSKQVYDTKSRQYIDGIVNMVSSVNSTSSSTGAVTIAGGVGIGQNLFVGGNITIAGTTTLNGNLAMGVNDITTIGDITATGIISTTTTLKTTDPTTASSTSTGAFQVTGGVGIGGAMYVGGAIVNSITTQSTSTSTGGFIVSGGVGIAKDLYVDGYTNIDNSVENHQSFVGLDASHTTFIASYKDNLDADYARGSRFVTVTNGSVSLTNGKLVLGSGQNNYVRYSAVSNANFTQQGTIKFKYTPNYSGTMTANAVIFNIGVTALSTTNAIWIYHRAGDSNLVVVLVGAAEISLGVWSPIAGSEYEFELDIDISNGASRLFVDGKQFGSTITTRGIRNNTSAIIQIGSWIGSNVEYSKFSMRDLEIFDSVQHTTDYQTSKYTPDYSLQNAITTYGLNASGPANLANLNVEGQQEVKFMASFASSINADYGLGSTLVSTTAGSVAITNGKLVLGAGTGNYVRYSAQGNADFTQAGAIKFKLTPNYSGIPANSVVFVQVGNVGSLSNFVGIIHGISTGNLIIRVYDSVNPIFDVSLGVWSPTAGTEYEFEFNMDITAGASQLFIDGILKGSLQTATGTRTAAQTIQIGDYIVNSGIGNISNFSIRDLIIYNTVQHTAAYTPGYSTESIYTTHISGPAKILGQTIMGDVNLTGHIESYNSNNLMRNTFSNTTLGTRAVSTWTTRVSAANNQWRGVCWSAELGMFCSVAYSNNNSCIMTSSDGIVWTTRTCPTGNAWHDVCWSPELGLFCSVSYATGTGNRVMTSPDGITWTTRASAADNAWYGICWSPELGLFCAVSTSGTANGVMTSPDGITWTTRTTAANGWFAVCWSAELGLFCAVSTSGTGNRVMTSSDGITWTTRASAADIAWWGVCWSPELGLFCAVANASSTNNVMTSPDGITWTLRTTTNQGFNDICWSSELGLFCSVATSGTGNRVMTSPDGIIWTTRASAADNNWRKVCWAPELGLFSAVSDAGTGNRVMTSKQVTDTKSRQYIDGIVNLTSSVNSVSSSTGALVVNGGIGVGGAISAYNDGGLYYKAYDNYNIGTGVLPWNLATGRILQTGITTSVNILNASYGGQSEYFAVRFMGWIKPLYTETYTFELTSTDDTAILFIDNREIVRSFNTTATGTIALTANRWVPIYIEWINSPGSSKLQVQWSSTSQTKQDIPAANMRYNQFDNAPSVLGTSIVNGIMTVTRTDSASSTSTGALQVKGGVGIGGNCHIGGTLVKGGGSFVIPHPDPSKSGWKLRHCFVESNTRGDNIYRYRVTTTNKLATIQLPSYFKYINENPQIWLSQDDAENELIGIGKGKVDENLETVTIKVNEEGTYNVLVIGTRKDQLMKDYWDEHEAEIPPQ